MPYPQARNGSRICHNFVTIHAPPLDALGYEIPRWCRRMMLSFVAALPLTFPAFWLMVARPLVKSDKSDSSLIVAEDTANLLPSTPTTITGAFIFIALAMSASQTYIIKRQFDGMDRRDERYGNVANALGQQSKSIEELQEVMQELREQLRELRRKDGL